VWVWSQHLKKKDFLVGNNGEKKGKKKNFTHTYDILKVVTEYSYTL